MSDNPKDPITALGEDIDSLQSKLSSLQEAVRLTSVRTEVEDIGNKTGGLPDRIRGFRSRGYVFKKDLEANAASLKERWATLSPQIQQQISQQTNELDLEMHPVEAAMQQLAVWRNNPVQAQPYLNSARSGISTLESKVDASQSSIQGMYGSFSSELSTLTAGLDRIDWMLNQVAQASFHLMETEGAIMAVEAEWAQNGKENKDDPKGILYLTDQRLVFEQKQEIATKKVLFIATEKQKVQKLLWEVPVPLIDTVKPSRQGLFGHEDHLEIGFASGAPFYQANLHINGQDCNDWQALLGRAKSHDFDQERAVALDQTQVEKVKAAPASCPSCGGSINQPVLRGMDSITCPYCGLVIRL